MARLLPVLHESPANVSGSADVEDAPELHVMHTPSGVRAVTIPSSEFHAAVWIDAAAAAAKHKI